MKLAIIILLLLPLTASACPDIPAAERVRIVKCSNETYAVLDFGAKLK